MKSEDDTGIHSGSSESDHEVREGSHGMSEWGGGGDDSGSVCICLGGEELHWGHREKGVVIIIVVYFITNIRGVVTFTANSKT